MISDPSPGRNVVHPAGYVVPALALGLLVAVLAMVNDAVSRHWWALVVAVVLALAVEGAIVLVGRSVRGAVTTHPAPEVAPSPGFVGSAPVPPLPTVQGVAPTPAVDGTGTAVAVEQESNSFDATVQRPPVVSDAQRLPVGAGSPSGPGVHVMWTPKSSHGVEQHEDAWAVDPSGRTAAIADGASSAFMSREWATILTESFVSAPPPPQLGAMREWVMAQAQKWDDSSIGSSAKDAGDGDESSAWWAAESHRRGSFATLVGVVIEPPDPTSDGSGGRWRCWAVGDSCAVQVRPTGPRFERVRSYPLDAPDSFGSHPDLVGTGSDRPLPSISWMEATWCAGDILLLMTDAVAEWALRADRAGHDVWSLLATATSGWSELVDGERRRGTMVDDDSTLVRLPCR